VILKFILCDIPGSKAPRTGPRHIWCTYTLCPFFGREKNTDGSAVGLIISLASLLRIAAAVVVPVLLLLLLPQNTL